MKVFNKIIYLLTIVILELVSIGGFIRGQIKTIVMVSPSSMKVQPSLTAAIDVKVEGSENLFASSVTLAFDSTILRYSGIIGGSFLTGNNANSVFLGVVPQPPPPTVPNRITVDQAICGGGTVSGSGILFTIIFTAIQTGSSPITIVTNELRNGMNKYILTQTHSGKVTVNNAPKAVQLLSPPNESIIDTTLSVMLVWSKSIDIDTGDIVRYKVHLASAFSNLSFSNLSDTTLTLTKDTLKENIEFTWYVDATDGIDTALSRQIFKFKTPMVQYPIEIPDAFKVEQNYPNPFNQLTTIRFSVPIATYANVKVYDITGREIIQLMSADIDAGYYMTTWNGKNSKGVTVGSGIYLYVVTAGMFSEVKKMVLLK